MILNNFNINLEIIQTENYKTFFEKLFSMKNFSIYWNRTYEPDYIKFDNYLSENFEKNRIEFSILKGNMGIGHVRYKTTGKLVNNEIQPFIIQNVSLCHNGNIINTKEIR